MQVMQSKENSGSARFMAIYLGGDGYRWHPAGQSNPIKRELHLLQHDQPTSAGNSRQTQSQNRNFDINIYIMNIFIHPYIFMHPYME